VHQAIKKKTYPRPTGTDASFARQGKAWRRWGLQQGVQGLSPNPRIYGANYPNEAMKALEDLEEAGGPGTQGSRPLGVMTLGCFSPSITTPGPRSLSEDHQTRGAPDPGDQVLHQGKGQQVPREEVPLQDRVPYQIRTRTSGRQKSSQGSDRYDMSRIACSKTRVTSDPRLYTTIVRPAGKVRR
jgi:hypothetical protein